MNCGEEEGSSSKQLPELRNLLSSSQTGSRAVDTACKDSVSSRESCQSRVLPHNLQGDQGSQVLSGKGRKSPLFLCLEGECP